VRFLAALLSVFFPLRPHCEQALLFLLLCFHATQQVVSPQRVHHFLRLALPLGLFRRDHDHHAAGNAHDDLVPRPRLSAISPRLGVWSELFRVSNRLPFVAYLPLVSAGSFDEVWHYAVVTRSHCASSSISYPLQDTHSIDVLTNALTNSNEERK